MRLGYLSSREDETRRKGKRQANDFSPSTTASGGRDWTSVAEMGGARSGKPSVRGVRGGGGEEGGEAGKGGREGREGGRTSVERTHLCSF